MGVEVDAARPPGREAVHMGQRRAQVARRRRSGRARARACPARSWWSSRRWRPPAGRRRLAAAGSGCPSVVSAGYRSPKVAMFASTVRSAAATAAAVGLGVGAGDGRRSPSWMLFSLVGPAACRAGVSSDVPAAVAGTWCVRRAGAAAVGGSRAARSGEAAVGPHHVEQWRGGQAECERRGGPRGSGRAAARTTSDTAVRYQRRTARYTQARAHVAQPRGRPLGERSPTRAARSRRRAPSASTRTGMASAPTGRPHAQAGVDAEHDQGTPWPRAPSAIARRAVARQARPKVPQHDPPPVSAGRVARPSPRTPPTSAGAHSGATSAKQRPRAGRVGGDATEHQRQATERRAAGCSRGRRRRRRRRRRRCRGANRIGRHPFSPVVAMPSTKYRWPSRKMTAIGQHGQHRARHDQRVLGVVGVDERCQPELDGAQLGVCAGRSAGRGSRSRW